MRSIDRNIRDISRGNYLNRQCGNICKFVSRPSSNIFKILLCIDTDLIQQFLLSNNVFNIVVLFFFSNNQQVCNVRRCGWMPSLAGRGSSRCFTRSTQFPSPSVEKDMSTRIDCRTARRNARRAGQRPADQHGTERRRLARRSLADATRTLVRSVLTHIIS